jgi:hypothetical protein
MSPVTLADQPPATDLLAISPGEQAIREQTNRDLMSGAHGLAVWPVMLEAPRSPSTDGKT